jgi:hypothetical protein
MVKAVVGAFYTSALFVAASGGALNQTPPPAQESKRLEAEAVPEPVSARLVSQIDMGRANWRPPDPSSQMGLVLRIRIPKGSYRSEDFKVAYKGPKGEEVAACLGYSMSMGWLISEDALKGWSLHFGNPVTELPFLFVVPKDVAEITLKFRGKTSGNPLVPVHE